MILDLVPLEVRDKIAFIQDGSWEIIIRAALQVPGFVGSCSRHHDSLSAIIGIGPRPACKYFHEGDAVAQVMSPEKNLESYSEGNWLAPASDLIQLNNDRFLLSNYPSSTSHALKATKMPAQQRGRVDHTNRSDSLECCGLLSYNYQVRTINDAAAVCAAARNISFFSFFRNDFCKEQWQKYFGGHVKEKCVVLWDMSVIRTDKRKHFRVMINIWWLYPMMKIIYQWLCLTGRHVDSQTKKGRRALPCCKLGLPRREGNKSIPNNCDSAEQMINSKERAVHWTRSVLLYSLPDICTPNMHCTTIVENLLLEVFFFNPFGCKLRGTKMPAQEGIRADLTNWSDSLVYCIFFLWVPKSE